MTTESGARTARIGALAHGHRELWADTGEAERLYDRGGRGVVRAQEPLVRDAVVRRVLG